MTFSSLSQLKFKREEKRFWTSPEIHRQIQEELVILRQVFYSSRSCMTQWQYVAVNSLILISHANGRDILNLGKSLGRFVKLREQAFTG